MRTLSDFITFSDRFDHRSGPRVAAVPCSCHRESDNVRRPEPESAAFAHHYARSAIAHKE